MNRLKFKFILMGSKLRIKVKTRMIECWKEEEQEGIEKIQLQRADLTLFVFRCRVQRSSTLRRQFGHSTIRDHSCDRGPEGSKPQTSIRDTPQSPFEKRMHRARWVDQSRPRSPPLHSHIQFCISSNSSLNLLHALDLDAGEAIGNRGRISLGFGSFPRLRSRGCCIASRNVKGVHEIRFANSSFVPTASPFFYLIDNRGMYLMLVWAYVLILCKRKIIYLYLPTGTMSPITGAREAHRISSAPRCPRDL